MQILDMIRTTDGKWSYADARQIHLSHVVHELLQWDITEFDYWVHQSDCWKGFPRIRQRLLTLRGELTLLFQHSDYDASIVQGEAKAILIAAHQIALKCKFLPPALRLQLRNGNLVDQRRSGTKLNPVIERRIQKLWHSSVESGERYGTRKRLADQYGLSVTTIDRVVK